VSLISDQDKKNVFFYADEDAKYYDLLEKLNPYIDLIHDTMVDLVEYSLTWKNEKALGRPFHILDVASGTGAEAFRLLKRFSDIHIVAVDFSPPMNREFRRKFNEQYPDCDFASCVTLIEDDFFSEACAPENLISLLPGDLEPRAFDVVIAGLFLNHYPIETQQEFYRRAHAALRPGGTLVLCEDIAFESQRLSEFAHDFGDRWIRKQFRDPDEYLRNKYNIDTARLRQQWIDHWQNAHIYAPDVTFTDGRQSDSGETNLSHASMALEAGFQKIGFPFRLWEAAILWGEK
jgi:SAM-dependent methyltransferase